ncbi:MAG: PEPxxWA-CTERM sorting domain-containing protein [Pseudomonadota bacterium]
MAMASPATAATTIFDETFEEVPDPDGGFIGDDGKGFGIFDEAGVWTAGPGDHKGIELQWGGPAGAPAADGGRVFVELDTRRNSSMHYTLLHSGEFVLDFLYSPRAHIEAESNIIVVSINGQAQVFTGPITGTNDSTQWREESFTFTGSVGDKLIIAAGGISDRKGGYIDNTKLTLLGSVPEPATWLMMILGLGAVGATMRQRQKATGRPQFS